MRVLFWSDLFWPYIGGSEIFAARLLLALRDRHEFIVVTRQDSPELPIEGSYSGIPVYRFPFCTTMVDHNVSQMMVLRREVAALKRKFAPDLIHVHNFGPSILFHRETMAAHPSPILFTVQLEISPYKNTAADTLMGEAFRSADWVNCVSSETLAQVHKRAPETISRSSVIFNGLDLPSLLPQPLPTKPPRLLCVGRLQAQKGFDRALTSFAGILKRFPHTRLIIAGHGPERSALERQAADLNLSGAVDFLGWISPEKVPELINGATAVVIPSRWEGLPLVALEASAMARPIVATRISGLSEIVLPHRTGLLVEPEDIVGLTEAIAFVLTHPEQATQMGQAGRRRVQDLFSWERCVADYDVLYRRVAQTTCVG